MKIQFRLLLLTISMTTVAVLAALLISSYLVRESLETGDKETLSSVLEARHSSVVRLLDSLQAQLRALAVMPGTVSSLASLNAAYAKLGTNAQTLLQQNYLPGRASNIKSPAIIAYDQAYSSALPYFQHAQDAYGWDDLYFISPHGALVFTLDHEKDFGTNLITGPWKDTGLARAVAPLLHDAVPGVMSFSDYTHYAPADNRSAAFLAIAVFDTDKQLFLGVLAVKLPSSLISLRMQDRTGLGESGESFMVGKDGWMLSDSRFEKESTVLSKQLKTQAVGRVLSGQSGFGYYPDYRGIDALVAFKPLRPFGDAVALGEHPQWGVIAKIDEAEVYAEFYELRQKLLWTGAALALLAVAAAILGARSITRPLFGLRDALARLSQGESALVPGLQRRDEIGEMAKAAEAFREMTQQVEHDHWIAESVAGLTAAVSVETRIERAANSVLHLLCEKLAVPVGAIYLLGEKAYKRVGSHGLARRSQTEDAFQLGVGLVGQCAKDNQSLVLSPVPAGLSIISTGLVEFPPYELVLYPIAHKNIVLAVLELAAVKSLSVIEHEFLKAASAALGLHLANLQASEHNLLLLAEMNQQATALQEQKDELQKSNEEMHALTEELRSQSEEMKAQNEELKANQEELRAQQDEMKHKNQMLETQSAQLEDLLVEAKSKAEDLQRANQYKSEFLANMSHELRTPLNSVLILSRDLAENAEHNLTADQVESASVISESGTQLLTLINDILDLSKIEAGKLELLKESFPLNDLLVYLRRLFLPQAEKKQLAFTVQLDTALPEKISSDKQRLTQVLSNLLSNAIKFTDSGEVSVSVGKNNDDLLFEIKDSGIGIPADKLDHIFGAFQQVDGTTSRKYGGSGLGLAISRHLTELLGGEIEVKSQLGQGSCFTVRLLNQFAHADTDAKTQSLSERQHVSTVQSHILVVEDDTRLLAILGRMIKSLGYEALCVESAEQAQTAIARDIPTGILLDLGLPHMNGMELLRRLKAEARTAQIPVYIMSGAPDAGEAKVLGALGFLSKPVTRDTIAAAIRVMTGAAPVFKRLLLVDAVPADIAAILALFTRDAVEMVSVNTGSDALQRLETQCFDAVILDLQLPDMTGFEWLKQARHLLNPPPVIVCSARELSEEEVFELKEIVESIVNKGALSDRLREEVMLAAHLGEGKIALPVNVSFTGKKLLLVDDDARNLFALTKTLRAKGFSVEVAPDSAHALEMLSPGRFDAVLTDIMMPEMDGYALIRRIRATGYSELPVIAITAKAMQGDDVLCMQAGATAYLAKPVDMNKLLEMLKGI